MEKLNILLNGKRVTGHKGETILQVAERNGIKIPTLCHDPRLEPYSSCFVCVVEVEGLKGLQPSCSTKVMEGMKVQTENEKVRKARKTALDLIVSNHYADCAAPCKQTCPAGVDVQGYISLIEKGLYSEAIGLIKEVNPLPAICGRVCVRPCEAACRRNLLDEGAPVGIDYMKRFAADQDLASAHRFVPDIAPASGKKVAIIGAGPGGLSAAYFLQTRGHQCDIFEANPHPGGWLRYGIPEYRLPNDLLDAEVRTITDLGVNIHYNQKLGDNLSYERLSREYDSTILTIGSQRGTLLGCEGEEAEGVFSGIDFLRNMEVTGQKYDFSGKKVAVVGGGNTAMDCCRTAMRCGAEKVYVVYRRTEKEMPANPIEIHESKLEGVEYNFLTNPARVNKDAEGKVSTMTCIRMELGAPDASGRRRPVPVEGSEFDIELDFILAAIGQKTEVNFMDDINRFAAGGELKVNRWGDIDADPKTLATGIPGVFAAGDGVTGPATLIEAVAQAKTASLSCHQYLSGLPLEPARQEFLSKRDNFRTQDPKDYLGRYLEQLREEMPTLAPEKRNNFDEVELGYKDEHVAIHESNRCLECGCSEYFTCDLKELCTEYEAEQKHYEGEYNEFPVDFSHPYIEIDNNKCILCSRCVRICQDVVGAAALGLVKRGFETYVAPSMGRSLTESSCESCGLCISACPTGAISENKPFKPGPVRTQAAESICNYCSVGCSITYQLRGGYTMGVEGREGLVNKDGNLCRYAKFGYHYMNSKARVTRPMLRRNGQFEEISFEEAYRIIHERIASGERSAFFAGARLSNEEQYLVQKAARISGDAAVGSFHYLGRESQLKESTTWNVPFEKLAEAGRIWLLGSEISRDNAVAGFMVWNASRKKGTPVGLITKAGNGQDHHKVDSVIKVEFYYKFLLAVNHYLLSQGMENRLFIDDRTEGFETYRQAVLSHDYQALITESGATQEQVESFAREYNEEQNAVLIVSEKEVCSDPVSEARMLAMITGKLGKTAQGLLVIREKNNSQGLFDMGCAPGIAPGRQALGTQLASAMNAAWDSDRVRAESDELTDLLDGGALQNLFIFGEDPVGTAKDKEQVSRWIENAGFVMVQDYFLGETASMADLVMPASHPAEIGGSFTNTQRSIQAIEATLGDPLEQNSLAQLREILLGLGSSVPSQPSEILTEAVQLFSERKTGRMIFVTGKKGRQAMFHQGCDLLQKMFDEEFHRNMSTLIEVETTQSL